MKPLRTLAILLLLAGQSLAANVIFYVGPTGQTLYVRFQTGASTYVATALTEGSSGGLGNYTASEATIAALTGMDTASTGNGYPFRVFVGSASASAADPIVAFGDLPWDGSAEVPLADLVAAEVEGGGTVSPFLVPKGHNWKFDNATQVTAPNSIVETAGFDDLLVEMDLSGVLNANASVQSITTVTVADVAAATEPTIVSSALRADKKAVNIILDGPSTTAATYTVSVKYLTTDGQTQTRKGRLVVQ